MKLLRSALLLVSLFVSLAKTAPVDAIMISIGMADIGGAVAGYNLAGDDSQTAEAIVQPHFSNDKSGQHDPAEPSNWLKLLTDCYVLSVDYLSDPDHSRYFRLELDDQNPAFKSP